MNKKEIEKFDKNNNEIYCKWTNGYEEWKKYDENNRDIYYRGTKNFSIYECWFK